MTSNEIPDFVDELIAAGCDITAIGHGKYVIGEVTGSAKEDVRRRGNMMGYDWSGARGRRMKIARYGTAVALAALLVSVATEVVTRAI